MQQRYECLSAMVLRPKKVADPSLYPEGFRLVVQSTLALNFVPLRKKLTIEVIFKTFVGFDCFCEKNRKMFGLQQ